MLLRRNISKAILIAFMVMGMHYVYASLSFSVTSDEKSKNAKYSLKNLSALSHKGLSFSTLRLNMHYKGPKSIGVESSVGTSVKSMLRFDNGNTTYIYPYAYKIKAPKFKTPTPPHH